MNKLPAWKRAAQQAARERGIKTAAPKYNGLLEFIPAITPRFRPPHHLRPLIDELELIAAGRTRYVTCHVPPQHGKTETLSHFIAYYLKKHPQHTVAYAGYAQRFAESKSFKTQRYLEIAGLAADERMANRQEWRTLAGGGLWTTSLPSGALTGQSVNLLIIDDPFKDALEAHVAKRRDQVWNWFENVAETRFQPSTAVVVIHTRWHTDDLIGRLQRQRSGYVHIRIPALADGLDATGRASAPDPVGRANGEPLLPNAKPASELEQIRRQKPRTFSALYQGLPQPVEGRLFGEFARYSSLPNAGRVGRGADFAYSKKTTANWTAVAHVLREGDNYYLLRVWRWQERLGYTKKKLLEIQRNWPGHPLRVENNGPQIGVNDSIEEAGVLLERFFPVGDKVVKTLSFREAVEAGRFFVPNVEVFGNASEWLSEFILECQSWTGADGEADDQIDAVNCAFEQLADVPGLSEDAKQKVRGW